MSTKSKTTGRVAREANTSPATVRNCVKKGLIVPLVLSDGRYVFDDEDVRLVRAGYEKQSARKTIAMTAVSSGSPWTSCRACEFGGPSPNPNLTPNPNLRKVT